MIKWFQKKKLIKELKENRPLPLGRKDFHLWANRIIQLAEIPGATVESQKFALCDMIMHCKPNESFLPMGHFVHTLRKSAASQVAHTILTELKEARNKEIEAEKHALGLVAGETATSARDENLKRLKGEVPSSTNG